VQSGHSVCVISTYVAPSDSIPGSEMHCIPLLVNRFARIRHSGSLRSNGSSSLASPLLAEFRTGRLSLVSQVMKHWAAPLELRLHVKKLRKVLDEFNPDIVHAMRIPYEGMLAAEAVQHSPLLISVWGNDLTLHASVSRLNGTLTRRSLGHADALHSDCERDIRLASSEWGFSPLKPSIVLPGGGGVQIDRFAPGPPSPHLLSELRIPAGAPVVINPRGFRPGSVRSDTFFKAIPIVLRARPDTIVLAIGMANNSVAERWISKFGIAASVRLLGKVRREQMAELFRMAWVNISISEHDGLPNTLLESLACGVFPVAGDIESIREWIEDGVNGLLVPPGDADAVAAAVLRAIDDGELRRSAAMKNREAVEMRGDYAKIMPLAEKFYEKVISFRSATSPGNTVRTRPAEQIE
jgi:glycosyltransferase involved in cell wall biosynthesis